MGHFQGTLKGSAPTATSRVGSVTSGLVATLAADAGGVVQVTLYGKAGVDCVTIELTNKAGEVARLYDGPLDYVVPEDGPAYLTAG